MAAKKRKKKAGKSKRVYASSMPMMSKPNKYC